MRLKEEEKRKQKRLENVRSTLAAKPTIVAATDEGAEPKQTMEERLKAKLQSSKPEPKPVEKTPAPTPLEDRPKMGFDRLYVKKRKPVETEEDTTLMNDVEQTRARLKQRKKLYGDREKTTLAKLQAFQSTLSKSSPPPPTPPVEKSVNVQLPAAWRVGDYLKDMECIGVNELLTHELHFDKTQKDSMSRDMHALDDYVVIDTRYEPVTSDDVDVAKWAHEKPNI